MKKTAAQLLSASLCIIMLTSFLPVFAENAEISEISGHWAEAVLTRAVADGYIIGSGKGLEPDGAIDRAQMSTIINRVLKAQVRSGLEGKTNASPDCWYLEEMEKAAYLGYLQNFGTSTMTAALNRKEAMTIIARAFSLTESLPDHSVLSRFSDASDMSGEAADAVASLVSDGFVEGSAGRLMPEKKVTRAEFLTMLYRITDACAIYGCGENSVTVPEGGSAVIRGDTLTSLKAAGSYDTVALAPSDGNVVFSPSLAKKVIIGRGCRKASLGGKIGNLSITGNGRAVSLSGGSVDKVAVSASGAEIIIASGEAIGELIIIGTASGCAVTINGTVKKLTVNAPGCTITGSGRVDGGEITSPDCTASVTPYGSALGQAAISFTAPETLSAGEKLTVQAEFENVPAAAGCALQWYVNGVASDAPITDFALKNGAVSQFSPEVKYSKNMADKMSVGLAVTYCINGALGYKYAEVDVALENYPASHYIAEETARVNGIITTYQYPATVLCASTLYSDWALKEQSGSVAKGTSVMCISSVGFSSAQIRFPDGRTGWVKYNSISLPNGNYTRSSDYAAGDKALWVNGRKYTSATDYLVWVSLACQKVNVFTKSTDGWALSKVFPCASGASATPTPVGTYKISYKQDRWSYNTYWCGPITGFYNGYAFHSWLTTYGGGAYDHTMGRPVSHGCIRMEDAGAQYMHTLPMNTTVVVF